MSSHCVTRMWKPLAHSYDKTPRWLWCLAELIEEEGAYKCPIHGKHYDGANDLPDEFHPEYEKYKKFLQAA